MEEKFEWSATVSGPREYPVRVLSGFIMSDNFSQGLDFGIGNAGWGNAGRTIAGSRKKELPDSLLLLWLSFAEKKFYRGEFELPREKILHYMNEGFMDFYRGVQQKKTYDTFVVGLAPGGRVGVWLSDGGRRQVELAHFQAREETGIDPRHVPVDDKHIFRPDYIPSVMNSEFVMKPEIKERIESHGYPPPAIYDSYAKRYPWIPEIRLPVGNRISYLEFHMCNGEREFTLTDSIMRKNDRGIPYLFFINWENEKEEKFFTDVVFSEDQQYWKKYAHGADSYLPLDFAESQIRNIFLEKIDKERPFKLIFEIMPMEDKIYVYLEQDDVVFHIQQRVISAKIH